MDQILLGLYHSSRRELETTLENVRTTAPRARVLPLPGGSRTGPAASFNRLAAEGLARAETRAVVFLEGGCRPAPDWLERLLAALASNPRHGLAGPSTNLAWNEQCAFPRCTARTPAIEKTGRTAARRFGDSARPLEPLHSLADFCYAVRRDVLEQVGAADEGYGDGPCWEMDYNARAARAGFLGVWVRGAFVYRPPLTKERQAAESRLLGANKRRYQDNLCALRLRGEAEGYEDHCLGEACEHFAPRELIVLHRPLPMVDTPAKLEQAGGPAIEKVPDEKVDNVDEEPGERPAAKTRPVVASGEPPLVSCLMPTADRRAYVARAIEYFERQDYPRRELVILDDGKDKIGDLVPKSPRIRYLPLEGRLGLGAKRNLACREAAGEILMHWDDDDWHAPHRISRQVEELRRREVELCGLDRLLFFDPAAGEAWRYRYPPNGRRWLAGGTFCFTRGLWQRQPFPDLEIGEDNHFAYAVPEGKMAALDDEGLYLALIHDANTSRKRCRGSRWQRVAFDDVRARLGDDAGFYDLLGRHRGGELPLVSCLMPTRDRRRFLPMALACFARQTYPARELVIVDDGEESVEDLVRGVPGVRYLRLGGRHTVGAKRNRACEAARGEIVVHWDDDDWYAPERLAAQVLEILDGRTEVSALAMRHVLTLESLEFWLCRPRLHARLHYRDLCPGTIAYRRDLWRRRGYPNRNCAEDVVFLQRLPAATRLERLRREDLFLCLRHGANTWQMPFGPRRMPSGWNRIAPPDFLPAIDLEHYRSLAAGGGVGASPDGVHAGAVPPALEEKAC